jgi:phosphoglycerate dehydrogenase-like enzyme
MHKTLYITAPDDPMNPLVRSASAGKLDLTVVSGDAVPQSLDDFDAVLVGDVSLATPLLSPGDNGPQFVQLTRGHHLDVDAAVHADNGITVAGASPVLAPAIAHHCIDQISDMRQLRDFTGISVGVVGFGRVGSAMAERCTTLGATVFYADVRTPSHGSATALRRLTLDMLLSKCDIVSLHVQWSGQTSNPLISERELRVMGEESIIVNAADARLVDSAALVKYLSTGKASGNTTGKIGGAVLDLEQPEANLFAELPNVAVTPYTAARTAKTDSAVAQYVVSNITTALSGGKPDGIVEVIGFPRAGDPAFWPSKMYPRSAQ